MSTGHGCGVEILSQESNMTDNLDDRAVLRRIAFYEAAILWQLPSRVHLLSACLYRLGDASYPLAETLGLFAIDVRRWARDFLPMLTFMPLPADLLRPLNTEYQIVADRNRYSVRQVRRPIRWPPTPEPAGEGQHIFLKEPDEWNDLHRRAANEMIALINEATRGLGDEPSSSCAVRSVLMHLLDYADIQECVGGLRESVGRWRNLLSTDT